MNNPIIKLVRSFKKKVNPLLQKSRPSSPLPIDMNSGSDTQIDIASGTKWATGPCCVILALITTLPIFDSNMPLSVISTSRAPNTTVTDADFMPQIPIPASPLVVGPSCAPDTTITEPDSILPQIPVPASPLLLDSNSTPASPSTVSIQYSSLVYHCDSSWLMTTIP